MKCEMVVLLMFFLKNMCLDILAKYPGIFWIFFFIRCMIYKHFLPFCNFFLRYTHCFLDYLEAIQLNAVIFVFAFMLVFSQNLKKKTF